MENTAAHPGPYDPLTKAEPDEPVFTLVGRDPFAPAAVLHWVDLARRAAMAIDDPAARRAELVKCTDAEMIACDMRRFCKDEPERDRNTAPATYSGAPFDKAQDERGGSAKMDARQRREAIVEAAASLREAAFHAELARVKLAGLAEGPDVPVGHAGAIAGAGDTINWLAQEIEPKRELQAEPLSCQGSQGRLPARSRSAALSPSKGEANSGEDDGADAPAEEDLF